MNNRRSFNKSLGLAAAGALYAQPPAAPPPDQPRPTTPSQSDIASLFPQIDAMAKAAGYSHSFPGERFASLDAWRKSGRAAVFECLGRQPAPVDPRPEIVDRRDMGGFVREKIVFSTTREFRVPAYLHIPANLQGPAPAIVDLHSHGGMFLFGKEKVVDLGANHPVMTDYHKVNYGGRPTATELARRGFVVITIDAFPFGERRFIADDDLGRGWERSRYSPEDVKELNAKCRARESTLVKSLTYAGLTWPGITAWDDIRTVDYLCTRPEVDRRRIGCVGVSFGGWRSLFLAGLDDRIAAACIVGFMSTVKPMIRGHMDTHSFVHFVPGLHRLLDLPDVAALRAPRPLMVLQCSRDRLFPLEGMRESVAKIAAIYARAGAADRFESRFFDVAHIFDPPMQDFAFRWFERRLRG